MNENCGNWVDQEYTEQQMRDFAYYETGDPHVYDEDLVIVDHTLRYGYLYSVTFHRYDTEGKRIRFVYLGECDYSDTEVPYPDFPLAWYIQERGL